MSRVLAPTGITSLNEEPAYFASGAETLFGLLTRPSTGAIDSALLMLPSAERLAYRSRVGVMIAHRLAAGGHQAFRFHYRGCGESTGKAGRFRLDNLFTEDAVGAVAWLRERGVERFLYCGPCFGARTALAAAAEEPGAAGVVMVAMPMSDYASGERGTQRVAAAPMSSLTRRAIRPKTLRGLRDRDIRRIYAEALRLKVRRLRPGHPASDHLQVSPVLVRCLTALIERRIPLLFLYGEEDSAYKEFLEAQNGTIGRLLEKAGDSVEIQVIPGDLHGWKSIPAGEAAVDLIVDWVSRMDRPTPVR